jgi:hypothetical protein
MDRLAKAALYTFCLFDLCNTFEDVASELHFDPETDVADGRDTEQVVMAGCEGSFHDMLGL